MLRRLYRLGRSFIFPEVKPLTPKTIELLYDASRTHNCGSCRFFSDIRHRCMRREGPYYKAPVALSHVCEYYEPEVIDPADDTNIVMRQMLCQPRGNTPAKGRAASFMVMGELSRSKKYAKCQCKGCSTCFYNPLRDQGVGYQGCSFPGEGFKISGMDGGKFCPSWIRAKDHKNAEESD